jgi:hypothetical protein
MNLCFSTQVEIPFFVLQVAKGASLMNTIRLRWRTIALVSVAMVAATATQAAGEIIKIVTPALLENAEGNGFSTPAAVPTRIQFLFPASEFASLPASNRRIVAFNFRSDAGQNQPVNWAHNSQIWMSTTDKTPLTLTTEFDDNHGANKTLVHDGVYSLPLLGTGPPQGPRDFADGPRLQTPFDYDPAQGNLLLDWMQFDASTIPRIDGQSLTSPGFRVVINQTSATAATGSLLNTTAAIRLEFDVIPEPSTLILMGITLIGMIASRRSGRRLSGP